MGTAGGIFQMTLPLYALSMRATTGQIGLISGASGLGLLLLVIPAGFLVDHFGSKRLFIVGSIAGAVTAFSLLAARNPAALIALTGCQGLFGSIKMTSLSASFYRSLKSIGIEKAGWFKGSMSIGLTFIGPILGGYLAKSADFPFIIKLLVGLMLIPTLLVYFFHDEQPNQKQAAGVRELVNGQLQGFKSLLRQRSICQALLMEGLAAASISTFITFIVVLVVQNWHLKPTVASTLLTLEGTIFITTAFLCGRFIDRFTTHAVTMASFALSALGFLGLALAGNFVTLVAATVVLGHGLGLVNLITSARIGAVEGDKGKVVGLFAVASGLGLAFGPLVSGLVGQYLGNKAVFMIYVPLFALLGLMVYRSQPAADDSEVEAAAELDCT